MYLPNPKQEAPQLFRNLRLEMGVSPNETTPLLQLFSNLFLRIEDLEEAQSKDGRSTTEISSAPTIGPAPKPLRSGTVSHREIGEPILRVIMAGSKSTKSMLPELVEFSEDSSTLQLTLRWPTPSGESRAGSRGLVTRSTTPSPSKSSSE